MFEGFAPDLATAPHLPLQQHPAHAIALRRIGARVQDVPLPGGGHATAMLRRLGPLTCALVPRGPVWPTPRAATMPDLSALRRALPRRTLLLVNGETELPAAPRVLPVITAQTVVAWDLCPDPATLRAGLHQKWRNRLTRAQASALPVHHAVLPADPRHWIFAKDAAQARANRYRTWPPALIAAHAAQGAVHLFTAGPAHAPIAAMLFIAHGARATYQIGWTSRTGRATDAHRLLLWHAALWLRDTGVARLDLGTIDTETAPGLARFKLGTGARARRLGATALVL